MPPEKICETFSLDRCYGNRICIFSVNTVDITDVENPVDNVEKASAPGERAVESLVGKVDKNRKK